MNARPGHAVLVVRTEDPATPGVDRAVAAGLGPALERAGWSVEVLAWHAAHRARQADLFLALAPGTDPSWAPRGAVRVGWALDEIDRWTSFGHLVGFDRVLATGSEDQPRVAAATPRGSGVLAPADGDSAAWDVVVSRFGELLDGVADLAPAPQQFVHFFPSYRHRNPYQTMLHQDLASRGVLDIPVRDLGVHLRRRRNQAEHGGDAGLLALHWTTAVLHEADGPFRARLVLDRFIGDLDAFLEVGGRLVWTVHNVVPHEVTHRWAELELAQVLADRADLVHVLSQESLVEVGNHLRLDPAKVVVIEHSSYQGQYPEEVTREQARERLGLPPTTEVLLALGGIRPYKGLDLLLDVLDDIARGRGEVRLLVAGHAAEDDVVEELRRRCEQDPRVTARFEHVPDEDLQVWFGAADVAVLPYRQILNSGAFLLAQTFGVPVVGPRAGSLVAWEDRPQVRLFEPGDVTSLATAVRDALDLVAAEPDAARAAARAAAEELSPQRMAQAYAEAITPWLGPRG